TGKDAMTLAKQRRNLFLSGKTGAGAHRRHKAGLDVVHASLELFQDCTVGDDHRVVLIPSEGISTLLFEDSNDLERKVTHADRLPDRIGSAKKLIHYRLPQNRHTCGGFNVIPAKKFTLDDFPVAKDRVLFVIPFYAGTPILVSEHELPRSRGTGADRHNRRAFTSDRFKIVDCQSVDRT